MLNRAKRVLLSSLVCLAMLVMSAVAFAAEGVDWEGGKISATGIGMAPANAVNHAQGQIMARRAAVVDAYRQLAEIVNGVNLDSQTTVQNMLVVSDIIRTQVKAVVNGATIIEEYAIEDGGYVVTVEMPMYGAGNSLAGAVMGHNTAREAFPPLTAKVEPTPAAAISLYPVQSVPQPALPVPAVSAPSISAPVPGTAAPQVTAPTLSAPPAPAPQNGAVGGYTGLIVDCSGLGLRPAMSPVIKNDLGTPIYGYRNLDSRTVISRGMAGYTSDINDAERAGSNPLVVRAVALDGSNPVISAADANRVLLENSVTGFLEQTNVVFVR